MAGNSEGTRKGNLKKVEKHGTDYFKRIGAIGGSARKRGYFGRLKDEGRLDELKAITSKGGLQKKPRKAKKGTTTRVSKGGDIKDRLPTGIRGGK
jgi:hypothetical protein